MRVRCPHCRNPMELTDDSQLSSMTCASCGSSFSLVNDETLSHRTGKMHTIGHFELLEQVGASQFGAVWKARDTQLDRVVALKIPRRSQLDVGESEQFFREARAAAQLQHPHIVGIHEVGRDGHAIYIVSDFVTGASLEDQLSAQRLGPREATELCSKLADALEHAHNAGVVHRDLKPANVMIDADGEPHVMDFGLAKREAGEVTITVEGKMLGTPAYMSPEQAKGTLTTQTVAAIPTR